MYRWCRLVLTLPSDPRKPTLPLFLLTWSACGFRSSFLFKRISSCNVYLITMDMIVVVVVIVIVIVLMMSLSLLSDFN